VQASRGVDATRLAVVALSGGGLSVVMGGRREERRSGAALGLDSERMVATGLGHLGGRGGNHDDTEAAIAGDGVFSEPGL
jgi:hypothetical protein